MIGHEVITKEICTCDICSEEIQLLKFAHNKFSNCRIITIIKNDGVVDKHVCLLCSSLIYNIVFNGQIVGGRSIKSPIDSQNSKL